MSELDREKRREYARAWKAKNPEKVKASGKKVYEKRKNNPDYIAKERAYHAEWQKKNKDKINAYQREYRKKKKADVKAAAVREFAERLKAESFIVAPETNLGAVVLASDIDRVAEKMLEGENER